MSYSNSSFRVNYTAPAVARLFGGAPRFGHPSDMSLLFSNDPTEQKNYMYGLLFAACFVISFFFLWLCALAIFKLLGQRRFGFLSGKPFRRPVPVELVPFIKAVADEDEWRSDGDPRKRSTAMSLVYEKRSLKNRPTRVRLVFILSGLLFICFAVLLVTQGLNNLEKSVEVINTNNQNINEIAQDTQYIIDKGIRQVNALASSIRYLLEGELNETAFCPANPSLGQSSTAQQVRSQAQDAISEYDGLETFISSDVNNVYSSAQDVEDITNSVNSATDNVDFTSWPTMILVIFLTVIPAIMVASAILALYDVAISQLTCFINWCLFPIFVLLVLLSAVFASGMIIGASVNGDFCLPGGQPDEDNPDTSVLQILQFQGFTNSTLEGQVLYYYIQQCISGNPLEFLDTVVPKLQTANQVLIQLLSLLSGDNLLALSLYCSRDFTPLSVVMQDMKDVLLVINEAVNATVSLIACDRIVPIYTGIFYSGTCDYSIKACFWCFISFLCMASFGFMMITCRAAYKPTMFYLETSNAGASSHDLALQADADDQPGYQHKLYEEDYDLGRSQSEYPPPPAPYAPAYRPSSSVSQNYSIPPSRSPMNPAIVD